jgi:hypothetical protein
VADNVIRCLIRLKLVNLPYLILYRIFSGKTKTAILDTGSSLIIMPKSEFKSLLGYWKQVDPNVFCTDEFCYYTGNCSDIVPKLKPLKFKFTDNLLYSIPATEYLIDGEVLEIPGYCIFGVSGAFSHNTYVLGDVFLRSFYSVFDFEK